MTRVESAPAPGRFDRRALAAVLLALAAAAVGLWWQCAMNEDVPFLIASGPADWIVYPTPGASGKRLPVEIETSFRRSFRLDGVPETAMLRLRAFRRCRVVLNDRPINLGDANSSWKAERTVDVTANLVAGENELTVRVSNAQGPPALWLTLAAGDDKLVSDTDWQASMVGAAWKPAASARGAMRGRTFDPDGIAERSLPSLARSWRRLSTYAVLVLASFAGFRALRRRFPSSRSGPGRLTTVALLSAVLLWTALLVHNSTLLRRGIGFDWSRHLEYVSYILEHRAIPLADEGWQMYQPPLYYAATAAVWASLGLDTAAADATVAFRMLNLVIAVANLFLIMGCLRQIFPGRVAPQLLGFSVAAFLPAGLYMAHFPTGEMLAVCLSSATVWLALRIARRERSSPADHAGLGACLGAALLAKFSALLLVPGCLGVVAYRWHRERREGRSRPAARNAALALAAVLLVCGWHYGRVWAHFGTPIVGNWDSATGAPWWQDPGYRTTADYLRFGGSLDRTAFAGFNGVWDGYYSTLWGDALVGGKTSLTQRPAWSHDLISAGSLLALLPTLAIAIGTAVALAGFLRRPGPVRALLLGTGFLAGLAMVTMSFAVPFYTVCKGFYGLIAMVPLVAAAAVGLERLMGGTAWRQALVVTLLGTWAMTAYSAYWIDAGSAATAIERARDAEADDRPDESEAAFRAALAIDGAHWGARLALADLLSRRDASHEEIDLLLEPDSPLPDLGRRHAALARRWIDGGQPDRALRHARQAVARLPDSVEGHLLLAQLLWDRGRPEESIRSLLEAVGCDPGDPGVHASVGQALLRRRRAAEAGAHCELGARLRPDYAPAQHCLGLALAVQGRHDEALPRLREAQRLDPGNSEIRDDLGRVLERIAGDRNPGSDREPGSDRGPDGAR